MILKDGNQYDEAEVWGLNDPCLKDYPKQGIGRRSLFCKRYDKCLYKAALKDWDCFNCEGCRYEAQGRIDFMPSEFICFDDDEQEFQTDFDFKEESFDCLNGLPTWINEDILNDVRPS